MAVRIVKPYEQGVLFRLGRVRGVREPGLRLIIPVVDVMRRVTLRIVTMPIQSQGIITRDNVSVDVSAVAYYQVADAVKSVVAIENVRAAIDQIAQTTLRAAGFSAIRPSRSAVFSALRSVERIRFSVACRIRRPSA
jgi:regulator of protease activity HflC (stomatin/prohibitin superfamily)